jgi:hypothetical protein
LSTTEFQSWLRDTRADLEALRRAHAQASKASQRLKPLERFRDYRARAAAAEWQRLGTHAAAAITDTRSALAKLEECDAAVALLLDRRAALATAAKGIVLPATKNPAWRPLREKVEGRAGAPDTTVLDEFASVDKTELRRAVAEVAKDIATQAEEQTWIVLTLLQESLLALAIGRFNVAYAGGASVGSSTAQFVTKANKDLRALQRRVWSGLRAADVAAAAKAAEELAVLGRTRLEDAAGHAAAQALGTRRSEVASRRMATLLHDLADAAVMGEYLGTRGGANEDSKRWVAAAKRMEFEKLSNGSPPAGWLGWAGRQLKTQLGARGAELAATSEWRPGLDGVAAEIGLGERILPGGGSSGV